MRQDSEESFGKIFDAAAKLAADMNVTVDKPRVAKRSVYRGSAVTGDSNDSGSVASYYRLNMYIHFAQWAIHSLN